MMAVMSRDATRRRILDTAERQFALHGFAGTSLRGITREAGVNVAAIHYHYGSKERLMNEALMVAFHRWLDQIVEHYLEPGPETLVDRFRDGVADFVDSLERNRPLVVACFEALAQVERSRELRRDLAATYEDWRRAMDPATAATLKQWMIQVVERGTGTAAQIPGIQVAGKTGTAENAPDQRPHAWFIAFAPADDPLYAIAVLVEHGGSSEAETTGGRVAAPVAAQVLRALLGT